MRVYNELELIGLAVKQIGQPCVHAELYTDCISDNIDLFKIITAELRREFPDHGDHILRAVLHNGLIAVPSIEAGQKLVDILTQGEALSAVISASLYDGNGDSVEQA
jgi:hypothetical protein